MKHFLLLAGSFLCSLCLLAQAPGTVKSAVRLNGNSASLGTSNSWGYVGNSIASFPDRDGDGIKELVFMNVEGNGGLRGVHIFGLNANGNVKANPIFINENNSTLLTISTKYPGNSIDYFGTALTSLKDLNGNGVDELVVTDGSTGGKMIVLFMSPVGGVDSFTMIKSGYSGFFPSGTPNGFGKDIANIGDVDKDGIEDLAVGSWYDNGLRGGIYILFMKSNGTVKGHKYLGNNSGGIGPLAVSSYFGQAVEGVGDLDNDGVPDIMAGSQLNVNAVVSRGEVWSLLLNADGSVKSYKIIQPIAGSTLDTANRGSYFGSAIAQIGDLDGDSINDIGVSAYNYRDSLGGVFGRVYVLLMNRDGSAKASQSIDRFHGNLTTPIDTASRFGKSIAGMGDINGDGIPDLAIGASYSNSTSTNPTGAIYMLALNGIPITTGIGDQLHNLTDYYYLYPNPTSDYIRIRSRKPLATALQVRLLDAAGRTVKMASGEGSTTLEIEVAHLPAGMYNIELSNGKDIQWGKFIKN